MPNIQVTTVNETLVVDSRLIAEELEINHTKTFLATIRKYKEEFEELGVLVFKTQKPLEGSQGGRPETFCYLNEDQAKFALSKSRNGLKPESIVKFKKMGFDFSSFQYCPPKRAKRSESQYSNDLAKELNGKREVQTLAGNIDVLTGTQIIEVKAIKAWKHALGQVLVYGHYYPSHQKRIHLYGETQESLLSLIKKHCKKFNVIVTWEA